MMNFFTRYKQLLVIGAIVVVAFIGYSLFLKPETGNPLSAQDIDPSQTAVEQELIGLLLQLRSIKLDTAIFSDERFRALKDFSQQIVEEPRGRDNPFAPLGQ